MHYFWPRWYILDTLEDIRESINETFSFYCQHADFTSEDVKSFLGSGAYILVKKAMLKSGLSLDRFEEYYNKYIDVYKNNRTKNTKPYKNVLETLYYLKNKVKLCVLSNKPDASTKACVDHYFKGLFDIVIGHRIGYKEKPDPNGILEILHHYNLTKEEVLYVGDMVQDQETAYNADVNFVYVKYGFGKVDSTKKLFEINSFAEIKELI